MKQTDLKRKADDKFVIIIDNDLPPGLIANASAVLSLSMGHIVTGIVGKGVTDKSGTTHNGITNIPIIILGSNKKQLKSMIAESTKLEDVKIIGFNTLALSSKHYQEYTGKMINTSTESLEYIGVALFGRKALVDKITGNLPLLK